MSGQMNDLREEVQDSSANGANQATPKSARLFLTLSTSLRNTLESTLKIVAEATPELDGRSIRDRMATKYLVNLLGQPKDEGQHGCSPGFATELDAKTAIRYLKGSLLVEVQRSSWPEEERHQRLAVNNALRDAFRALQITNDDRINFATELSFLMVGRFTVEHWCAGMTLPAAGKNPPGAVG